jgi:PHD/YefM family antitoxin component YafN of YafNO toxin-antitoxin module
MFETRGSATIATMSDLKNQGRQIVDTASRRPVHLLRDGQHVGTVISPEATSFLMDALEERYLANSARERLAAIRSGEEELISDDDFWAQADALMAERK